MNSDQEAQKSICVELLVLDSRRGHESLSIKKAA